MIETVNKNLLQSGRKNISFRVMDNLKMDIPDNYFDNDKYNKKATKVFEIDSFIMEKIV